MNRLYVVESAYSITGAKADHRFGVQHGAIPAIAQALGQGSDAQNPWVATIAKDLQAHRGQSLVVAGRGQSPEVHATVAALNDALGNTGTTVTYTPLTDAVASSSQALGALVETMKAGGVKTLVILGGNPVYTAPADLAFADAMKKVGTTVHVGSHADETAAASSWQVPLAHPLESWGDCRAADGTLSVMQPLILPLRGEDGGRGARPHRDRAGQARLRRGAGGRGAADGFEKAWRTVLHDGLLMGSALAPASAGFGTGRRCLRWPVWS